MFFRTAVLSAGSCTTPVESISMPVPFGEHLNNDPIIVDLMGSLETYYQLPSEENLFHLLECYRVFRLNIGYVS